MAMNTFKCNYLTPLQFIGLKRTTTPQPEISNSHRNNEKQDMLAVYLHVHCPLDKSTALILQADWLGKSVNSVIIKWPDHNTQ